MKTKLAKIGYVANSFNTVLGDFISAGRLYEYIGGMCNPNLIILNFVGGREMRDWMDFDGDGEVDSCERMFAEEMLCTSKEEHEALFGDAGDFDDDMEDDFEIDAMAAGLDVDELELMDPDERAEALEEAGLDPDDYDFY